MLGLLPLAALLAIFLCLSPGSKAGATPVGLTVMTHNVYVGADADAVLSNPTLDTIAMLFQSVVRNDFPARAAAMARKAASAGGPLLVGFKEASIINAPNLDFRSL